MKIHLIKEESLVEYAKHNARSKVSLNEFTSKLKDTDWNQPIDMKSTFNSADILGKGSERVIFNIGGNEYRVICKYYFGKTKIHLYVKWIGTHTEYTKICEQEQQYTVSKY